MRKGEGSWPWAGTFGFAAALLQRRGERAFSRKERKEGMKDKAAGESGRFLRSLRSVGMIAEGGRSVGMTAGPLPCHPDRGLVHFPVIPTEGAERPSGGISLARFLNPVT